MAVKGNQPKLANAFERNFPMSKIAVYDGDSYTTQEESHGRQEMRLHVVGDIDIKNFKTLPMNWWD